MRNSSPVDPLISEYLENSPSIELCWVSVLQSTTVLCYISTQLNVSSRFSYLRLRRRRLATLENGVENQISADSWVSRAFRCNCVRVIIVRSYFMTIFIVDAKQIVRFSHFDVRTLHVAPCQFCFERNPIARWPCTSRESNIFMTETIALCRQCI